MNTARFAALPVARPRRASRASRPAAPLRVRAEAPEAPPAASSRMADDSIGLGGMMEDMMANAAGGTAVPGWVPAVPELEMVLKVLASDSVVISDKLLVERYGEALFAATGFTKRAEAINGRLAMVGFVAALGATFQGDVLVQFAKAPMAVVLTVLLVATGTLVPEIDAEAGYIPGNVRGAVEKLMAATKLDEFFSETAERMMGMLIFALTATIF